jgi:RhtB (resistance to homoserine/threonine) family protein
MILAEWLAVTAIASFAIISPGPGFAIVVKNSLNQGRRSGMATAIGNACGDMAHIALNLLGIGLLIASSPSIFELLKVAGALYLFWLGYKGLLSKPLSSSSQETSYVLKGGNFRAFLDGLITTILNPKAFIFVFALFSVIVSTEAPLHRKIFYGGWIGLISLSWFTIVAIFFTDKKLCLKLQKNQHWLNRITGIILILFAIEILLTSPLDFDQAALSSVNTKR